MALAAQSAHAHARIAAWVRRVLAERRGARRGGGAKSLAKMDNGLGANGVGLVDDGVDDDGVDDDGVDDSSDGDWQGAHVDGDDGDDFEADESDGECGDECEPETELLPCDGPGVWKVHHSERKPAYLASEDEGKAAQRARAFCGAPREPADVAERHWRAAQDWPENNYLEALDALANLPSRKLLDLSKPLSRAVHRPFGSMAPPGFATVPSKAKARDQKGPSLSASLQLETAAFAAPPCLDVRPGLVPLGVPDDVVEVLLESMRHLLSNSVWLKMASHCNAGKPGAGGWTRDPRFANAHDDWSPAVTEAKPEVGIFEAALPKSDFALRAALFESAPVSAAADAAPDDIVDAAAADVDAAHDDAGDADAAVADADAAVADDDAAPDDAADEDGAVAADVDDATADDVDDAEVADDDDDADDDADSADSEVAFIFASAAAHGAAPALYAAPAPVATAPAVEAEAAVASAFDAAWPTLVFDVEKCWPAVEDDGLWPAADDARPTQFVFQADDTWPTSPISKSSAVVYEAVDWSRAPELVGWD
ncbi:hypothetical protein M885DRAFT_556276 [Pelagophyceae sp. CCMP2097]|nr:hypothetical protein M885DRAFT_556276 [Pelagophyceae sp. CCMP2097]